MNWSLNNFQNGGFEAQLAGEDVGRLQREDALLASPQEYQPLLTAKDSATVWSADKSQRVEDPTRFELALDPEWHDV